MQPRAVWVDFGGVGKKRCGFVVVVFRRVEFAAAQVRVNVLFIGRDGFQVHFVRFFVLFQVHQRTRHQRQLFRRIHVVVFVIFDEGIENLSGGLFLAGQIEQFGAAQIRAQLLRVGIGGEFLVGLLVVF